jgi:hypothetical protein
MDEKGRGRMMVQNLSPRIAKRRPLPPWSAPPAMLEESHGPFFCFFVFFLGQENHNDKRDEPSKCRLDFAYFQQFQIVCRGRLIFRGARDRSEIFLASIGFRHTSQPSCGNEPSGPAGFCKFLGARSHRTAAINNTRRRKR